MKKLILYTVAIGITLAIVDLKSRSDKQEQQQQAAINAIQAAPPPPKPEKYTPPVLAIPVDQILSMYNTDIDNAEKQFKNKQITVQGHAIIMSKTMISMSYYNKDTKFSPYFEAAPDQESLNDFIHIIPKQLVKLTCAVAGAKKTYIDFNNCKVEQ